MFGDDFPSIHELDSLASLILINQHFSLNYPRPLLPSIIEVGGMHVSREIKPLDKDFKDFIDGAKEGVIYFSMGSNLRSDQMAPEKIFAFAEAFAELPQRVIWKWNADTFPGEVPKNLKLAQWMPQQEILGTKIILLSTCLNSIVSIERSSSKCKNLHHPWRTFERPGSRLSRKNSHRHPYIW